MTDDDGPGQPRTGWQDQGFTPGARDVEGLLEYFRRARGRQARSVGKKVVAVLSRGERGVATALARGLWDAGGEEKVVRLRALAKIAQRWPVEGFVDLVDRALVDGEPRVVREGARLAGKIAETGASNHENVLLSLAEDAALPERKAAVEALGRVGGREALVRLRALVVGDEELGRRVAEAVTLIERRAGRTVMASVREDQGLPGVTRIMFRARPGGAAILADQARSLLAPLREAGTHSLIEPSDDLRTVGSRWSGDLATLYKIRAAVDVGLVFDLGSSGSLADRIVDGLEQSAVYESLTAWTRGPLRFRLSLQGRRRAVIWEVARRLYERKSPLINDSRDVVWSIEVDETNGLLRCVPKGADRRFAYRKQDVPAASHPSLAATLAWLGQPRAGQTVWDPFCGTGTELIECAHLAENLHLIGSDSDPRALEAAHTNFAAAPARWGTLELRQQQALAASPGRIDLIVTNPPMGRRVASDGSMRPLLAAFVRKAANVLHPGGCLVWVSASASVTAAAARAVGLTVEDVATLDMGGFAVSAQKIRRTV